MPPPPNSTIAPNLSVQPYEVTSHIQTQMTGNRVSKKCSILGGANIILGGKCIIHTGAMIRGDLKKNAMGSSSSTSTSTGAAATTTTTTTEKGADGKAVQQQQQKAQPQGQSVVISMGRYCALGESSVLRPPYKIYKGIFSYYPLKMGDYVHVGASSIVEAVNVGSWVEIGKGCIVGRFTTIKDCVRLLDRSVVAPHSVISSGTVWGGSPARYICDLPETWAELHETRVKDYYSRFRPAA